MTNPNDAVYPLTANAATDQYIATGLTIRQHFALEILKSLLSNSALVHSVNARPDGKPNDGFTGIAVATADELIRKLNREGGAS